MATMQEGIEAIEKLTRQYEALKVLADAAREMAGIEQAIRERRAAVASLDATIGARGLALADAEREVEGARARAADLLKDAELGSDEVRSRTGAEVNSMLAEARRQADLMREDAEGRARDIKDAAEQEAENARADAKAQALIRDAAVAELDAAREELVTIKDQIETARATLRQMLGG